ncbi:transposase [Dietzia sp. NCCP-2495]|uniref:transposase n=2 Tax=unclassified Dietzia TaxID=2617939 RepID=UPI002852813E|nr:transposase [Dietzia sp. NCCP-2495]
METSITREGIIGTMGAPRKYPDELRERATRMALEALADPDRSHGAIVRVAEQLGVHREALRTWVRKAQAEGQDASSVSADRDARLAQLEKENRELRRANTILKQASAFFAAELDRPQR